MEFIENPEFTNQLERIGNIKGIDDSLAALEWALTLAPEQFDIVTGFDRIRVAKTDRIVKHTGVVPALRVYFTFDPQRDVVHLLWIEADPEL